jgi:pyrroloquinoline-quinone synthase
MATQDFIARLDDAIRPFHVLNHPFYQAWNAGTLTRETLQEYARQYYQFEKRFPRFISAIHSNCDDLAIRQELLWNIQEEEQGELNHPELWMRFADALDCARDSVRNATSFEETSGLLDTLNDISRNGSTIEGVAALYAYESQIPEVARTKIEGLKKFYNVSSDEGLRFFAVHEKADEAHSAGERSLLERLAQSREDEDRAIAAAQRSAKAFYEMLTGIVRECNVKCEME